MKAQINVPRYIEIYCLLDNLNSNPNSDLFKFVKEMHKHYKNLKWQNCQLFKRFYRLYLHKTIPQHIIFC